MSNFDATPGEPQDIVGQPTRPSAGNEPGAPNADPPTYGQAPHGEPPNTAPLYLQAPYGQGPSSMPPYGQVPYGAGYAVSVNPAAPWGADPTTGIPYSGKSRTVAGLLQILLSFLSICGVGRLYSGHIAIGLIQMIGMFLAWVSVIFLIGFLLVPVMWIWTFVDGILMLTGSVKDETGRPLRP